MANLSNINNKLLVGTNGEVRIGDTATVADVKLRIKQLDNQWPMQIVSNYAYGLSIDTSLGTDGNAGSLQIYPNSGGGFIVRNDSRVGIGTTSPDYNLEIENASSPTIATKDTTNNVITKMFSANSQGFIGTESNHDLRVRTNNTDKITIQSGGNVGIGTTSPDNILHIRKGDTTYASQVGANTMLFLETTNVSNALQFTSTNTGQQYIMFGDDDPNAGWISYNHGDNNMNFRVNAIERMRIDSSGISKFTSADQTVAEFNSTVTDGPFNVYRANGTTLGYIGNAQGIMNGGTTNFGIRAQSEFVISTNGAAERLRIDSSGNSTFAGHIAVEDGNNFYGANSIAASSEDGNFVASFGASTSGSAKFARNINVGAGNSTFGGSINTSGLLIATAIDTDAYLADGSSADLHGRYLGQAIYGSGTGSGDNYGTLADVLRYKQCDVWRKNSSTNVWSNPSDGDTLVQGNYAAKWSGINMEPAYSEYVFYFSNGLGYSFLSQTIIQHSTNGNSFNFYIEIATSTTNPYDTTGWTTKVTKTGISSWPGLTCIQQNWEVGGGYPGLMRIRIVPTWNNSNLINLGSFQAYGSYGTFSHAWSTLFDRSVNFQSKIGVGTNPSRALDVTQTALIQGAGNVNAGTLALGPRASGVGKWSTISGAHYNQSSGSGNGSGAAGIMIIGTYGANGENDIYVGGGPYEMNAATNIRFYTHTTDTSTAGGSIRMGISSSGRVTIGTTVVADAMCTIAGNSSNYALNLYADVLYSSNYRYQRFRSGSNIAGGIESSNQTSVVYSTSSDYRMKKNIKPLEDGLDRLCKLKPVKFDWKLNDESTEGFIAHEVQDVFPDAISGEKDGEDMQGMDYGRITPLLVAAIQELKAEIELLKSK